MKHFVYIISNKKQGVLYIGSTKQLKKWNRAWKIELIENQNPEWKDLYDQL